MKLPNGDKAIIDPEKLSGFLLNVEHEAQPGHAILFRSLLGIRLSNSEVLRDALLQAARTAEAVDGRPSPHGRKYEVRFPMSGPRGTYTVLSVWIVEHGKESPRLVTAYVE
jgi:hypothetical protein